MILESSKIFSNSKYESGNEPKLISVLFVSDHQASRAQILKKAAEYIDHMRRKNNAHQQDIDVLKKENKILEEKSETNFTFYRISSYHILCKT